MTIIKMLKQSKREEKRGQELEEQVYKDLIVKNLQKALRKSQKWKSPIIDKVFNFWLNTFDSINRNITNCFNRAMKNLETNPKSFTQCITYLPPKLNETNKSKNYKPKTCVSTMYKMLISIITERKYNFLDGNNILPAEQRGCKRGSMVVGTSFWWTSCCWKKVFMTIETFAWPGLITEKLLTVSHTHGS